MNSTVTVFVLALDRDSALIARALRGAGYRVVDPRELGDTDPAAALQDCDAIVTGPGWATTPENVDIFDASLLRDMLSFSIGALVPHWRSA